MAITALRMLKPHEWSYILSGEYCKRSSYYGGSFTTFEDGEIAYTQTTDDPRWIEDPVMNLGDGVVVFDDCESMPNQTDGNQQAA